MFVPKTGIILIRKELKVKGKKYIYRGKYNMKGPHSHALVIYPPLNNKCMALTLIEYIWPASKLTPGKNKNKIIKVYSHDTC